MRAQPDGDDPHESIGQRAERGEVVHDDRAEAGQDILRKPLVRSVEAKVGRDDVGLAGGMLGRQVDLLPIVHAVVRQLRADALPPTEVPRRGLGHEGLGVLGESEERLQSGEVAIDQSLVDAVVDEHEEAHLVKRPHDILRRAGAQGDLRDLGEGVVGHGLGLHGGSVGSGISPP